VPNKKTHLMVGFLFLDQMALTLLILLILSGFIALMY